MPFNIIRQNYPYLEHYILIADENARYGIGKKQKKIQ